MAASNHAITKDGLAYKAKLIRDRLAPTFTRAVAGSGYVDPELLEQQQTVSSPIAEMSMDDFKILDDITLIVPTRLTSREVTSSQHIQQIGVYAMDPDKGEILYQLLQFEDPYPLASVEANNGNVDIFDHDMMVVTANAPNATINSDPYYFVGREEFEDRLKDLSLNFNYDNHLATVEHGMGRYPHCLLLKTKYALGVVGLSFGPIGGTDVESVDCRLKMLGRNALEIYTTAEYEGEVEVHKIDEDTFSLVYTDGRPDSLLVTLR